MYHYNPSTALEELTEDATLPNPGHVRDMISATSWAADQSLELNRIFVEYQEIFRRGTEAEQGNLEAPGSAVNTHMGRDALLRLRSRPIQAGSRGRIQAACPRKRGADNALRPWLNHDQAIDNWRKQTIRGSPVVCLVTGVETEKNTADVKATRDVIVLHKDVPCAKICRLDEGQSGLRIVTEAPDER
jgi:hypothetical protein